MNIPYRPPMAFLFVFRAFRAFRIDGAAVAETD